jgi:hypothetical protein
MAAISMTQDSGFHMNPRNLRILLSCTAQDNQNVSDTHNTYVDLSKGVDVKS